MSETEWIDVMSVDDLPTDDIVGVTVGEVDIAIYRVGSDVFATSNVCTHGMARLSDGFLEGHAIECPLHQGRFDIRNGLPLCEPVVDPLQTYPVRIVGARVLVQIS